MLWEVLLLFILGAAVGSFLTVVVERYDTAESFWNGRSHCNHCKINLSWWELLPIAGYVILNGKCVRCKKIIPKIYPLFELITGLSFVAMRLAAQEPVNYIMLAAEIIFVSTLLMLAFYDWINRAFPLTLLAVSCVALLIVLALRMHFGSLAALNITLNDPIFGWLSSPTTGWVMYIKGGVIGSALLGLLAFPSRGRWMGYGDVLLAGLLGLWLGYPFIIMGIVLAFYLGAIVGVWLLAMRKSRDHRIAFGPFLIAGSLVSQVWGQAMFRAIMKLWGV